MMFKNIYGVVFPFSSELRSSAVATLRVHSAFKVAS